MSFTREQLSNADMGVLFWQAVGVLIGKGLGGASTALGVCLVLKLFGVI